MEALPSVFTETPVTAPTWLAALLALAGDIEQNPGPWTCNICNTQITNRHTSIECNHTTKHWLHLKCTDTTIKAYKNTHGKWKCNTHTQNPTPQPQPPQTHTSHKKTQQRQTINPTASTTKTSNKQRFAQLRIMQININGINNKLAELTDLIHNTNTDIVTIQETKLTTNSKTPQITGYTAIRTDRQQNKGGGLLTYIKHDITFTSIPIPQNIDTTHTEIQLTKIHLKQNKSIHIANIYIPPHTTNTQTEDAATTNCLEYVTGLTDSVVTGDFNAHSSSWHSPITDHRGNLISDIIEQSTHRILNTDTPTRIPPARNQQPTSPDITTISTNIQCTTTWNTTQSLSSDHLPILITIDTKTNFRLIQHRKSYTNYNKANWVQFAQDIEDTLANTPRTDNVHESNKIITDAILQADKKHIPKGKINNKHKLLPEHIRDKIKQRDIERTKDSTNTNLSDMNKEISSLIQKHKQDIWQQKLDGNWDHRQNTHILWNTINTLSNKQPVQQPNRTITFGNKLKTTAKQIATSFNKQFINNTTHKTDKNNRKIDRRTSKLQSEHIDITSEQVRQAIMASKNNNSTGPDNINIKHLKHLGPIALSHLAHLYTTSLNTNVIPQIWKLAKIVPILKPSKDAGIGSSYRPISLLSPIAKTLEKIILPHITNNIPNLPHQHGYKKAHSTTTALHSINNIITRGFNEKRPPSRTVMVALDMSKAFDTVNIHKLIHKLHQTNIPPTILKYTANYIKGRKAYTTYQNKQSKPQQIKAGVPQGGTLSPTLFNIYMSDLPTPPEGVDLETYADDITTLSTHTDINTAQDNLQPYLQEIHDWTVDNNLQLNATKSSSTLFTPDTSQYNTQLRLHINNTPIPTVTHPKILGLTFDPKLTYNKHIQTTKEKAQKTTNILKTLTSTHWGKQKETIITTYKTITRPILEFGSTVWSPIASNTNISTLQTIQNTALRTATGCTADTNTQHLHEETKVLPIKTHLQLHASQLRQKAQLPTHPLHKLTTQPTSSRHLKQTTFDNTNNYTTNIDTQPQDTTEQTIKNNIKTIHTQIVHTYLQNRQPNKILGQLAPPISETEQALPRKTRRTLAQLRTGKSPLLQSYKHKIDPTNNTSPLCPLCHTQPHTTNHLFTCTCINTNLTHMDLWTNPVGAAALLDAWEVGLRPP